MADIKLSKNSSFKFSTDRDFLDYEPVSIITKTIDKVARKVAENTDTLLIEACTKVDVDPDALINTMKRVRAQEAEIKWLKTLVPPCRIGQEVWAIRNTNGTKIIRSGKVSEMYYVDGMRLCIVAKNISRGEWRKVIFPTYEEARKYLEGESDYED